MWWIRFADASGRYRREKAGTKSAAITLYYKRKQEALEGRKLPEAAAGFVLDEILACQLCSSKDHLHLHHIFPTRMFPLLRREPENLISLCRRWMAEKISRRIVALVPYANGTGVEGATA